MHALRSLVLVAALMAALVAPISAPQASAAPEATLSDAVVHFLDGSALSNRMEVIVTFRDRSGIDQLRGLGVKVETTRTLPMALATLTGRQILDVASWSVTQSVWENATSEFHLSESRDMINAEQVWAGEGLQTGYRGAGVGVAIVDSGIDGTHPDVLWGENLKKNFVIAANPLGDGPALFTDQPVTVDDHGHGTHVAGTAGGSGALYDGKFAGVAPDSDLYGFKIGSATVLAWYAIQSFDWVLTEGAEDNVRVINNSWGGGGGTDYNPDDPVNVASKLMYDNDIVVVFAAGNGGSPNTMGRNSVSPHVVSVAAVNKDFTKAGFSSAGRPSGDLVRDDQGIYRPTITAPGVDIAAPRSISGGQMSSGALPDAPEYTVASGTSMASPHVAGVVALMLEANPDLTAQNVIDILECTATPMPDYHAFEVGPGMVDALAAVQAAESGNTTCALTLQDAPFEACSDPVEFSGTALPGGFAVMDESTDLLSIHEVEVTAGVDALYAQINWLNPAENIYLFLFDPEGNEVESSAGLLDPPIDERRVLTTYPEPGTWTIAIAGRINTATPYDGWYGMYCHAATCEPDRERVASQFEGTVLPGLDVTGDRVQFEVEVPESTETLFASLAWEDSGPTRDLDLYIRNPDGQTVASGATADNNPETATAFGADPVAARDLEPGTWIVEVHGWAVTDPTDFVVDVIVTTFGECSLPDAPAGDTEPAPSVDDEAADVDLPATGGSSPIVLALLMVAAAAAMRRRGGLGVVADR